MITDVCVPISQLAECLIETQKDIEASQLIVPIVGHVGDGNFHFGYLLDPNSASERATAEQLNHALVARALRLEGTCSGEHGVGSDKRCYMDWMFSADDQATMQLVRRAFDPDSLANPGKIFPTPKTCGESLQRLVELKIEGVALPEEALVF